MAESVPGKRQLRPGCYLLRYTPRGGRALDGTLRVQRDGDDTIASGDLYLNRGSAAPDPAAGIPIFPIAAYRHYVRVTQILEGAAEARRFTLGFELLRLHGISRWTVAGSFRARMAWTSGPAGLPSPADFLRGKVRDGHGDVVGSLTMAWVSPYLRRATVEIDRVGGSELPLTDTPGLGWRAMFDPVGWDVTVVVSDSDVVEPSGESWSKAELHAAMLERRDRADLDREWRYWLLCVKLLDRTDRGIMFDIAGTDSNNAAREGAGIASHWMVPDEELWGSIRGVRFGTATDSYFRTAVHEIGHAMALEHNELELALIMPTDSLAKHAQTAGPPEHFPENTHWGWSSIDGKRLRHWPDLIVRPGGVPMFTALRSAPALPDPEPAVPAGVELAVSPLLGTVPLGAPVRLGLRIGNPGPLPVPTDLALDAGHVSGTVTDPSGAVRSFRSIIRCVDAERVGDADTVEGALTLLRGAEGALFPFAGSYTVAVVVRWSVDGRPQAVTGAAGVVVTAAVDDAHAAAAARVLETPDALLTLALGGDHLPDGQAAIAAALENEILRPHYAYVEAKRVAAPFFERPGDPARAAALVGDHAVMSPAEAAKAARWTDESAAERSSYGHD